MLSIPGTMNPGIEIWNIDIKDEMEPVVTLGGEDKGAMKAAKKKAKKKKKSKSIAVRGAEPLLS